MASTVSQSKSHRSRLSPSDTRDTLGIQVVHPACRFPLEEASPARIIVQEQAAWPLYETSKFESVVPHRPQFPSRPPKPSSQLISLARAIPFAWWNNVRDAVRVLGGGASSV